MEYKYTKNDNYEDFASGRVLYHVIVAQLSRQKSKIFIMN